MSQDAAKPVRRFPVSIPAAFTKRFNKEQRNFWLHVLNGIFFAMSEALADIQLIITALLSQLTTSSVLIGLLAPLRDTGWFLPQLFLSHLAERTERKIVFYRVSTIFRFIGWIGLVAGLLLLEDPTQILWAFFISMSMIAFWAGVGGLGYMTVTAKVIPVNRRGLLFGVREFLGGALAIAIGGVGALILGGKIGSITLAFPHNYGLLFAVSAVLFLLGSLSFCVINEPPDSLPAHHNSFTGQMRRAWQVARQDADFRHFIVTRAAILFARAGVPFITVYAKRYVGVSDAFIGTLVSITIGSALLAGLFLGRLNDRRGSGIVVRLAIVFGAAQIALALLVMFTHSVPFIVLAFVLGGISNAGFNVSLSPLILHISPDHERPLYIGLGNTLLGVVMLLTSLVGLIAAGAGFAALFVFCLVCFALAFERVSRMRLA